MKRIVAIALAISLMATPASAITTGNWDMGAANQSASNAASKLWQEQQNRPEQEVRVNESEFVLPEWIIEVVRSWKWW